MKKTAIALLIGLLPVMFLPAGEVAEKKEEVRPITEDWRETLKFGIAEEVIAVVQKIKEAEETSLNPELVIQFKESINNNLKQKILEFFIEQEYGGLAGSAEKVLQDPDEHPKRIVTTSIRYLAALKSPELMGLIEELTDSEDDEISLAAITAVGKMENGDSAKFLLEKLDDDEFPNKRKPDVILSLGKIKAGAAVDRLIEIISDRDEERIWRMYACDSLGKIGNEKAIPAIKKLFTEDDALVRAYAASALADFDTGDTVDILIQGLRDTNWKVRQQAARGLADPKAAKAVDILKYKVEKDPVKNIQYDALKALGKIGTNECYDYLREIYTNDTKLPALRDIALGSLIEHDLNNTIKAITEVTKKGMGKAMGKDKALEMTGKKLMTTESTKLTDIYKLFMESSNWLLRVYGIRGAANNKIASLKTKIEEMSEKDPIKNVKKEALTALGKY